MTISIKPTASGSTIEQDGSTILTVDGSGNITPSNQLYPKVPAFSAYGSSSQTLSSATWTKIQMGTEEFDTTNDFDNATNYRFTPSVAGYYQVNGQIQPNASYTGGAISLYKNGSSFKYGNYDTNNAYGGQVLSTLVYLNGSTDYIELYSYFSTGQAIANGHKFCYFQAHLVSV